MKLGGIVTIVYGLLIGVGGVMGFVKEGSQPSLISGLVSALLAWIGAALLLNSNKAGLAVALLVALALAAFGAKSVFVDHRPFMPRGLILTLSVVEILALIPALTGRS